MAKNIAIGLLDAKVNGIQIDHSIKCNPGNYQNKTRRNIEYLVFHYTGNKKDNAKNNALYFKNNVVKVSAHFFTDDTRIHQSVELPDVAFHCGTTKNYYHSKCRNANSIGIEMCCTAGNYMISEKTIENTAYLGAMLCQLIGIKSTEVDIYCLRHYDVTHKKCPTQMVDDVSEWNALKSKIKSILEKAEKKETAPKTEAVKNSFFPARGYFKKGDTSTKISKIASFMRKNFPSYTSPLALGPYFGKNLENSIKEFQKRTGLEADGCIGPLTLAKLKKYGFEEY